MKKVWIAHRIETEGITVGTDGFNPIDALALAKFMNEKGLKPGDVIIVDPQKIDLVYWYWEPDSKSA